MTVQEFSTGWDVLWDNIASNQGPGLNEYEKSIFLTKAQSQLVKEYFNKRTDGFGGGFDGSEKRQYEFSNLIRTSNLFNINTFKERITSDEKLDKRSLVYLFPSDYFLAVNEIISDGRNQFSVIPLEYSEYQRLMLKPYSYPVRKGAWRLFTDRKNCNYCREYIKTLTEDVEELETPIDYTILTTWADQKRNLSLHIEVGDIDIENIPSKYGSPDYMDYYWTPEGESQDFEVRIIAATKWNQDITTYNIFLGIDCDNSTTLKNYLDDEGAVKCLQSFFKYLKDDDLLQNDTEYCAAARHLDGMVMCSAPSKFTSFQDVIHNEDDTVSRGKTLTTKVIQLPVAEIIGKFSCRCNVEYQLRYVRTLKPIILVDLANDYGEGVSINGLQHQTECELPEELHQEILERAVTLAKISWQGSTSTLAANTKQDNNQ